MGFSTALLLELSEWGWFLGFILGSVALAALAVFAAAVYEGYRERTRPSKGSALELTSQDSGRPKASADAASGKDGKKAA